MKTKILEYPSISNPSEQHGLVSNSRNVQYTIFKKCNFVKLFHRSSFSVTNISLFVYEMGITYC